MSSYIDSHYFLVTFAIGTVIMYLVSKRPELIQKKKK
jgi:hypothetical protein